MKPKIIYLLLSLILFTANCQKADFDHVTEGIGGLIGIRFNRNPSLVVIGLPATINEGSSVTFNLKFSNSVDSETVTITDSLSKFIISPNTVTFNSSNATLDQSITITAIEDSDSISEDEVLTFSSQSNGTVTPSIQIVDQGTRAISLSIPVSSNEGNVQQVDVSLRIPPPEGTVTLDLTPSDPAIKFTDPITLSSANSVTLTFTQANYNISQKINYTIDDIYNDNRSYSITATIAATATIPTPESVSRSTSIVDNDYLVLNISDSVDTTGQSFNSGLNPSIDILSSNSKFYVAVKDNSNSSKLGIYSCDLAGKNCSILNKGLLPSNFTSGSRPKLSVDQDNGNVFITTTSLNDEGKSVSWKTNSNLDSLTYSGISSDPYLLIDAGGNILPVVNPYPVNLVFNNNLINLYNNGAGSTYFQGLDSNLFPFSYPTELECYGLQNFGIGSRGFKRNSIDGNYYNALTIGADNPVTFKELCNFHDWENTITSLYYPTIEKIDSNGFIIDKIEFEKHLAGLTPDLGIDTINNKIILLTANYALGGIPYIFRCDITVTTATVPTDCTEHDISTGFPSSTYFPKLNIDLVNQKILVLAYNVNTLYLYHCNLDATNCKVTDISGGKSLLTSADEHNFDSVLDVDLLNPANSNNRLLVVFTEKNTGKLIFTRFGLGGF